MVRRRAGRTAAALVLVLGLGVGLAGSAQPVSALMPICGAQYSYEDCYGGGGGGFWGGWDPMYGGGWGVGYGTGYGADVAFDSGTFEDGVWFQDGSYADAFGFLQQRRRRSRPRTPARSECVRRANRAAGELARRGIFITHEEYQQIINECVAGRL